MPNKKPPKNKRRNDKKRARACRRTFTAIAAFAVKHRFLCAACAAVLLTGAVLLSLYLGTSPLKALHFQNRTILFGSYPQTRVTAQELLRALNEAPAEWKPFDDCFSGENYYGTMRRSDGMQYADAEYEGKLYRGVRFDAYRPAATLDAADAQTSYQDDHGYTPGNVYWFLWEPIRWYVADEKKGLLLSEKVLDAVQFGDAFYWIDRNADGVADVRGEFSALQHLMLPANLYKTASIRRWLNGSFYTAAFTSAEQHGIKPVLHRADESARKTRYGLHSVTRDRVWLLSAAEALAWKQVGGSADALYPDATDYAKCRGAFSGSVNDHTSAWWWTRSAGDFSGDVISVVDNEMFITSDRQFPQAYALGGVRCAIRLKKSAGGTEG